MAMTMQFGAVLSRVGMSARHAFAHRVSGNGTAAAVLRQRFVGTLSAGTGTGTDTDVSAGTGSKLEGAVEADPFPKIDLRIGIIETVSRHPAADSLFVLSVDVGEKSDAGAAPRTIVSGLVGYYSEEQLQGKKIVVLANMKARKLRGVLSQGMLLAAANTKADATQVEVLEAGAAAQPGDIVGLLGGDDEAVALAKAKAVVKRQHVIEAFLEGLSLDNHVAKYRGRELVVSGGAVTTQSLLSGMVG